MDRISAAIVAKDESANLRQLLPMLRWADEVVVVVDARTQDATAETARAYGCRVMVRPFDTYADQRNAALALAQGDWVFWLDADERPSPGLAEELRQRASGRRAYGFRTPIRSWIFGRRLRWGGIQDDRPVRVVRR
ncbi:MAG TPA: glycosyltransferase, partial [Thermoguttaceae bacterium]|nr:glycosyltransferase [Thermoguttaceae bacterium]